MMNNRSRLAESLGLPSGWRAFRYVSGVIEIEDEDGKSQGVVALPYDIPIGAEVCRLAIEAITQQQIK